MIGLLSKRRTSENKGSNVLFGIPRNMIINLGCASVDNHIPCDDISTIMKISGRTHDAQRRCAYGSFT